MNEGRKGGGGGDLHNLGDGDKWNEFVAIPFSFLSFKIHSFLGVCIIALHSFERLIRGSFFFVWSNL
jgi:hypothetical protein